MKMLTETTATDLEVITDAALEIISDAPEVTDLVVSTPSVQRKLDFTVIHGYLRGDHACAYEVHATGCKDLRSKQAKHLFSYNIYAPTPELARDEAVDDLAGSSAKDFWIQPCCGLKRMKAIGRA